jgi:KipI family sensor histidine kinase inhibitor
MRVLVRRAAHRNPFVMSLHAMGDTAYLISFEGPMNAALLAKVRALAADLAANRLPGVTDIVPAYASVGVLYTPEKIVTRQGELPWRVVGEWIENHLEGKAPAASRTARAGRTHVVPVCYGGEAGPDLEAVAKATKLSAADVVKMHTGASYQVAAIGFTPGFPYLWGMPEKLAVARRTTPRVRVAAGSVGIGGVQTGIYPSETPGGWNIIGRTVLDLFNPQREEAPSLLAAGDTVKFKAVDKLEPVKAPKAGARAGSAPARRAVGVEVLKPGTLTSVQDLGRVGRGALGVGQGGALDPWAAMVANLAVGNPVDAPVLECTYVGPVLRFTAATTIAVCGAEVNAVQGGRPVAIKAGETVDCSAFVRGARLYIAVAGGIRVAPVLGGAGTMIGAGFGGFEGRALREGDRLVCGERPEASLPSGASWHLAPPVLPRAKKEVVDVRIVPGPDWARIFKRMGPGGAVRAVESRRFQLSSKSDRMGLRLNGDQPFTVPGGGEGWSRPVVPGTVQLPPDGLPIVLMGEGQTIGGYAQLGQVASLDLAKLAQARPGAEIVFRVTDLTTAQQARLRAEGDLARLRIGLGMLR